LLMKLYNINFLALAAFLASFCSCAKLNVKQDFRNDIKVDSIKFAEPKKYLVEDKSCWMADEAIKLDTFEIDSFVDGKAKKITHEFTSASSNTNKQKSLTSDLISGTAYGYHSRKERSCAVSKKGKLTDCTEPSDPEKIAIAKFLRICEESGSYQRNSVEGVALSTIAHLETSHSAFEALENKKSLGKSWLFMMPNYEDVWHLDDGKKSWDAVGSKTDNAGFSVTKSGEQLYVIYPKSIATKANKIWKDINLWEVPWVITHEFSHNIFVRHYANFKSDAAKVDESGHVWDKSPAKIPGTLSLGLVKKRPAKMGDGLLAINEGFADLMSFYLLGPEDNLTKGLPCMSKIRSIHEGSFPKGGAKILNNDKLELFISSEEIDKPKNCETYNGQDPHHMGAIFAYQFNKFFNASTAISETKAGHAQMLLDWLNRFSKMRKSSTVGTIEGLFKLAVVAAAEVSEQGKKLTASQCKILKTGFPVFSEIISNSPSLGCE
jgi:hypothetical protein